MFVAIFVNQIWSHNNFSRNLWEIFSNKPKIFKNSIFSLSSKETLIIIGIPYIFSCAKLYISKPLPVTRLTIWNVKYFKEFPQEAIKCSIFLVLNRTLLCGLFFALNFGVFFLICQGHCSKKIEKCVQKITSFCRFHVVHFGAHRNVRGKRRKHFYGGKMVQ